MESVFEQPWLYALIAFVLGVVVGYLARGRRAQAAGSGPKHALADKPAEAAAPSEEDTAVAAAPEPVESAENAAPAAGDEPAAAEEPAQEEPQAAGPSGLLSPAASRAAAERARQDPALNQLDDELRTSVLRETRAPATPDGDSEPADAVGSEEVEAPAPATEAPTADADVVAAEEVEASVATDEAPATADAPADAVAAGAWQPGPYPASALPGDGGAAPAEGFTIKAKAESKLFHTETSPYYRRVKPDVWFRSEADAVAAGFTGWVRRAKAK